ncbi:unnamed protein product [Amoebophrya sp. A120]|nr:unnamed protein product [Amoebophrya sp. A120]|eukprot:GSA120T00021823001.1
MSLKQKTSINMCASVLRVVLAFFFAGQHGSNRSIWVHGLSLSLRAAPAGAEEQPQQYYDGGSIMVCFVPVPVAFHAVCPNGGVPGTDGSGVAMPMVQPYYNNAVAAAGAAGAAAPGAGGAGQEQAQPYDIMSQQQAQNQYQLDPLQHDQQHQRELCTPPPYFWQQQHQQFPVGAPVGNTTTFQPPRPPAYEAPCGLDFERVGYVGPPTEGNHACPEHYPHADAHGQLRRSAKKPKSRTRSGLPHPGRRSGTTEEDNSGAPSAGSDESSPDGGSTVAPTELSTASPSWGEHHLHTSTYFTTLPPPPPARRFITSLQRLRQEDVEGAPVHVDAVATPESAILRELPWNGEWLQKPADANWRRQSMYPDLQTWVGAGEHEYCVEFFSPQGGEHSLDEFTRFGFIISPSEYRQKNNAVKNPRAIFVSPVSGKIFIQGSDSQDQVDRTRRMGRPRTDVSFRTLSRQWLPPLAKNVAASPDVLSLVCARVDVEKSKISFWRRAENWHGRLLETGTSVDIYFKKFFRDPRLPSTLQGQPENERTPPSTGLGGFFGAVLMHAGDAVRKAV